MSIITGVRKGKQVSVACDTQANYGSIQVSARHIVDHTKLVRVKDAIIGLAGWTAVGQIIEHVALTQKDIFDFGSRMKIYESLLRLQEIMKEKYFLDTHENKDQPVESNQLSGILIHKNGLFELDSYREVHEFNDFWAIGSGQRYALGAMHAVYDQELTSEEIATAGIKAAAEFDDGCQLPAISETLNLK